MRSRLLFTLSAAAALMAASPALADPCGMVPPIYTGPGTPITRIGLQQTYVFHKDGVETFVIRPGFEGKVDEFGMLIPFPTPPAIRKVPDHIFPHVAAAVDPPEVVIDLTVRLLKRRAQSSTRGGFGGGDRDGLRYREVKVLKEEAVGMYEVAVLEAGSAEALKRWMDEHGYRYPDGMDKPCNEYVEQGWCFVAVKTKVGTKKGADPAPGQREIDTKLPDGSVFDGHVQAMGFRFESEELVVPMRLSAFNAGELRNVVYILADGPRKIRSIPEEYVMRQVSGGQLVKNVTDPLPLRIIGGTEGDIPEYWRKGLPEQRNPEPKNGAAAELFASDILAIDQGELTLPHEEHEKVLLNIGEELGLRGAEIDQLHADAIADERAETRKEGLKGLGKMTMTVVDGDFPREVLGGQNLTFAAYKMPAARNKSEDYDPKLNAPAGKQEGVLKTGALAPLRAGDESVAESNVAGHFGWIAAALAAAVGLVLVGGFARRLGGGRAALLLAAAAVAASAVPAFAQEEKEGEKPTIRELLAQLEDKESAPAAVEALVARAGESKELLKGEAIEGNDLTRRGWAIVALSEIGGDDVDAVLKKVHMDEKQPMLVRTWAAAARVSMTDDTDELIAHADLVSQFPALGRPVGMKLVAKLNDGKEVKPEGIVAVSIQIPQLQAALAPAILALGPEKLTEVLTEAKEIAVRQQAAGYLGTLAQQQDQTAEVAKAVVKAYRFDPKAEEVPWEGGPLFVPGINWDKENAKALAGNLVRWHLWCDRKGKSEEQKQIHNNIRSVGLAGAAGYQSPGFQDVATTEWLAVWGRAYGKDELKSMLEEQGVEDVAKYADVLNKL